MVVKTTTVDHSTTSDDRRRSQRRRTSNSSADSRQQDDGRPQHVRRRTALTDDDRLGMTTENNLYRQNAKHTERLVNNQIIHKRICTTVSQAQDISAQFSRRGKSDNKVCRLHNRFLSGRYSQQIRPSIRSGVKCCIPSVFVRPAPTIYRTLDSHRNF